MIKPVSLHPEVAKLAKDFKLKSGKLAMAENLFVAWKAALAKSASKEDVSRGLIALAARFEREGGDAASVAIVQLSALSAHVLTQGAGRKTLKKASWATKR